ncbi:hypothetical protein QBC42DRAFT_332408 [Cladorrhinum samala]|uniref:Wax synthase domain-containing protein n=1 Tax=Cladorrhinum samala TaxID=585594 RepID=A0AAV9HKR2_9PEZI|nr:hypothetical protein QBC42DRAFT_332408 [Cladorrhinum samala]
MAELLTSLIPLLLWGSASLLTMWALPKSYLTRILSLPVIWLLTFLSLLTANQISDVLFPGASITLGSVLVFYLPWSHKLLFLTPRPSTPAWLTRYKIWNNPRGIIMPITMSSSSTSSSSSSSKQVSQTRFLLARSTKSLTLYLIDLHLVKGLILPSALIGVSPSDFSPEMELKALLSFSLTTRQLLLRSAISLQWIWSAYFFLTFYHSLVSILFVSVLGWDAPHEWPPLFGRIGEAYTVRRFWGGAAAGFWHRLTVPTYSSYAEMLCEFLPKVLPSPFKIGLRRRRGKKTVAAGVIFLMSGLSHALSGWAMGDHGLARDVVFFLANFLVCALEVAVGKSVIGRAIKRLLPRVVRKLVGVVWVFAWFFLVSPVWMYPKIYPTLVAEMPKFEVDL